MPMTGLAIGAGVGVLKNQLVDVPEANRQRILQAAIERYSPWTGQHGQPVANPNPFSAALGAGATGASMGAAYNQANLQQAAANRLNTGGSLGGWGGGYGQDLTAMPGGGTSTGAISGINYAQPGNIFGVSSPWGQ